MPAEDRHAKTEKPTPKRKREAREEGRLPRSPDVAASAALVAGSFIVPWIFGQGERIVFSTMTNSIEVANAPTTAGALTALGGALRSAFVLIVVIASMFALLGVIANIAQIGPGLSLKALRPKLDRVSPKAGFKRLFSPTTVFGLGRQTIKLALIGVVGYSTVTGLMHKAPITVPTGLAASLGIGSTSLLAFVRLSGLLALAVGLGDYAYARHKIGTALKMTKQQVKEEAKASEGDPTMRAAMRKRQYAIARSRTIAAVRTADVVIANPTHFCVALQYRPASRTAPRVVAKGSDHLARRMREEAATYAIPLVEDPPLARYLYATCEEGHAIPAEIYVAVAKLLAFIYSLPERLRGVGVHHRGASIVPFDPAVTADPELAPQLAHVSGRFT
jgi:flagellar biosynthetic protein FlhB